MARCRTVQKAPGVRWFNTLPVILIAEGWTTDQETAFDDACAQLWPGLLDVAPFGLLHRYPQRVSVFSLFSPSEQQGPALGTAPVSPARSPAGSTWDQSARRLRLDRARVLTLLNTSSIGAGGASEVAAANFVHGYASASPGLVAFLLPPVAAGQPLSVEFDSVEPWAGTTFPPEQLRWVAVTVDDGWPRVVARALARSFGLGDEWVADGPQFDAMAEPRANASLADYPNLTMQPPPAGAPGSGFAWYDELDARGRSRPLTVVTAAEQSTSTTGSATPPVEPIRMVEGGGWYRTKVYRSAVDCFMRTRIGDPVRSPRTSTAAFCEVCRRSLTRAVAGSTNRRSRVGLDAQRSQFDRISSWKDVARHTGTLPAVVEVADRTTASGPYWTFHARIGASVGGLAIEHLKLLAQGTDGSAETVAELVEFRDIAVEFSDGQRATFDVARALASTGTPPVLEVATDGQVDPTDNLYHHGLNLTMVDDYDGRCPVEVAFSLVLCGEDVGIEPTGGVVACKLMPQIAMRWLPGGELSVKRFRACVRIVLNNKVNATHHQPHDGTAGTEPDSVISAFTDGNAVLEAVRQRRKHVIAGVPVPLPAQLWWAVFDYHKPDFRDELEVEAVRGPLSPSERRTPRSGSLAWPPGSTDYTVTTTREHDQGQYDNVHAHGSMGADPYDPRTPKQPMVHAPACAEACVHLHWRWGTPVSGIAIGLRHRNPSIFMGWRRPATFGRSVKNDEWGAPLIPPNQELRVAVTHPDTGRSDSWADVVATPRSLDPARKAIWWTVDVCEPTREAPQVVLEPGLSFAFRYKWDAPAMTGMRGAMSYLTWELPGPDPRSREELMHLGYSMSRWYLDPSLTATSEQIPTGRDVTSTGVRLEDV